MDAQITKETLTQRPFTILAGGCLLILCVLLFTFTLTFGYSQIVMKTSPTLTPEITPTQHILVDKSDDKGSVIHEDFSSNKNDWSLYYPYGKIEVTSGKLILQSNIESQFIIGTSSKFNPSNSKYYLQADFSTDIDKPASFGLIFGISKSLNAFYAFEIRPDNASFRLMKFNSNNWSELVPFSRAAINSFPQTNTLGVNFKNDQISLYINNKLVSTFSDNNAFHSKDVGVFSNNNGFRLIVDDFFILNEK